MIISASRRTDIPAYYGRWMLERLKTGSVSVRNPFNPKQIREISLSPYKIDCIVFWTKNPAPMLPLLHEIDAMGYRYYFQFTLTPYDRTIEKYLPPKTELIRTFRQLSEQIGKQKIVWRYDPILFTAKYGVAEHIRCFQSLAERLTPYTERCVISFLDFYRKTERNMAECPVIRPGESMIAETAGAFKNIAENHALELRSCCEGLELYGIRSGACIDPELVEKLTLKPLPIKKDKSQRPLCNCAPSVDIGSYNTCGNGCIYCYANTKPVQKKGT